MPKNRGEERCAINVLAVTARMAAIS